MNFTKINHPITATLVIASSIMLIGGALRIFTEAQAAQNITPSTGAGGSCLANPFKSGGGSVTSGYAMKRCKGNLVSGGANSNLTECEKIRVANGIPPEGRKPAFFYQDIHSGVDFSSGRKNGDHGDTLVAPENAEAVFAGWSGRGIGNVVAMKRANGDVYTFNHLYVVDPVLKGAVGAKSSLSQGMMVNKGSNIGVEGRSDKDEKDPGHSMTGVPVHLHMNYFLATSVKDYASKGYSAYGVKSTEQIKVQMDDVRKYMCASPLRKFHPNEVTQHPKRVALGEAYFQPGSVSAEIPPTTTSGSTPEQSANAQNSTPVNPTGQTTDLGPNFPQNRAPGDDGKYGMPDAPPYQSYATQSAAEVMRAEATRRSGDPGWNDDLLNMSRRGIMVEAAYIDGAHTWFDQQIYQKRQRIESLLSTYTAMKAKSTNAERAFANANNTITINKKRQVVN